MSADKIKYLNPTAIDLPNRQWPSKVIDKTPMWCSVDLRDGNQALPNPMNPKKKLEYFKMLCDIGFKHIEVAFPSASADDFAFTQQLVQDNLIPDDVFIMGLTQCRDHLIEKTFASLAGAKQAILHTYIATSDLHMKQVFSIDKKETLNRAVLSTKQIRTLADAMPNTDMRYQFSPEEYTDTDLEFALEICTAVFEAWGKATPEKPLIMNLPATVERRSPNQYADMIEWFCNNFKYRDAISVSIHSHNDQGMAVAGTELCLLAGADRVEGTLFGHGERTGNVDVTTVACNLESRGIKTGLDFSNLTDVGETVERLTGMPIYYRQPYVGEYVFTAFSGSHQDAIRKGMGREAECVEKFGQAWRVPYLHIDPSDLGREYENLIRINSQSGKGGVAWVLEQEYGVKAPKAMHPEIGVAVQKFSDDVGREITSAEVNKVFLQEFIRPEGPFELIGYWPRPDDADPTQIHGEVKINVEGKEVVLQADGNGPISAFVNAMRQVISLEFTIDDYHEEAVGKGADAVAYAFVPLKLNNDKVFYGVGTDTNIDQAAVCAIVSGLNRISINTKG